MQPNGVIGNVTQAVEPDRDQQENRSNSDSDLLSAGHNGGSATIEYPAMTLKNAALLALIGTILITGLLVWEFVFSLLNVLRGLVPAVSVFSSFIYAFGCFSVAVFFYAFHRAQ